MQQIMPNVHFTTIKILTPCFHKDYDGMVSKLALGKISLRRLTPNSGTP